MNDITTLRGARKCTDQPSAPRPYRVRLVRRVAAIAATSLVFGSLFGVASAKAAALAAPYWAPNPTTRTESTISARFFRSPDSGMICQADIGYEMKGGQFTDWHDVGWFPHAPCDDPDPGYKFKDLGPGTTYTFSVRAYRLVGGVKTDFSSESTITATTLGATPTPTPTPTEPTPPAGLAAPQLAPTPSNRTETSLSVRLTRSATSAGTCQSDIGYEVKRTPGADWSDVGGFASTCASATVGYKFTSLQPGTTYELAVRAYRLVDGVKAEYSGDVSITATTLGATP